MAARLSNEGWECGGKCGTQILLPRGVSSQAPPWCERDDRMFDQMDAEEAAKLRYDMAIASGLSDTEAREEGWPGEGCYQEAD